RSKGQDSFAEQFIEHLRETSVDRGKAADDSFVTGKMPEAGPRTDKVANSKEKEKNSQRTENDLSGDVQPQGADEHDGSEQSPHGEIRSHCGVIGRRTPSDFWQHTQNDEG